MEAVILAGGLGTRLRSVIADLPKPMAPINGRPFLQLLLDSLNDNGFKRVILSVGYKHEVIFDYFGNQYREIKLIYSIEYQPLGTGGAIAKALQLAENQDVFVLNGDTYLELNYLDIVQKRHNQKLPVIAVRYLQDAGRYGSVKLHNGYISEFNEKSGAMPGFINAGCYLLPKNTFNDFNLPECFSFEIDFLPSLIERYQLQAYEYDGLFIDIGIPEDYQRAQKILAERYE